MLANIGFDTPENEPPNVPPRSPRSRTGITVRMACCGTGMSRSTGITVLRVVICVHVTKKLCVLPSQGEKGGGDGDTEWYPRLQIGALKVQSLSSQSPRARTSEPHRARSRLYRSQILQVNTRWKALAEIYTLHSFAPFSNRNFFVKNC